MFVSRQIKCLTVDQDPEVIHQDDPIVDLYLIQDLDPEVLQEDL